MSIIGESFEGYVKSQINTRQILHGKKNRNNLDLNVLSNQNAWVKLASSVQIISAPTKQHFKLNFLMKKLQKHYTKLILKTMGMIN